MNPKNDYSHVLIITGTRSIGKTSLCFRLWELAKEKSWDTAGILSPAIFEGSTKVGIEAVDLRTGERRRLACPADHEAGGIQTRNWLFNEQVVSWANKVLEASIPCDLLLIDELGTLEFERYEGWLAGFAAIDSCAFKLAIVVIRPELKARALQRWKQAQVFEILPKADIDNTAKDLFTRLEKEFFKQI